IGCGSGSFQNDGVLSNNDGGGGSGNTSETKFGFQRNEFRQNPLVGTVQIYDQYVFLCYKNPQVWPPHVEAAEFDRFLRLLSVALLVRKAQMKKQVCYFDFRLIGPVLDELDRCFEGLVKSVRAQPINLPGTAYYHALQAELEKKKGNGSEDGDDLLDGLMRIKDEHGETLCDDEVVEETIRMANIAAFTFRLVSQDIEYKGNNLARLQLAIYLHHLAMRFKRLTHFDVNTFVEEVFIKDSEWLLGTPRALRDSYIFVCSHGSRDHRDNLYEAIGDLKLDYMVMGKNKFKAWLQSCGSVPPLKYCWQSSHPSLRSLIDTYAKRGGHFFNIEVTNEDGAQIQAKMLNKATQKVKQSEKLYASEVKIRKEMEKALARETHELNSMTSKLEEVRELSTVEGQKRELEIQIFDSKDMEKELEVKLVSFVELMKTMKEEQGRLELARDETVTQATKLRISRVKATSSQAPQFLSDFSLLEIEETTHNFDQSLIIGGENGSVYRGFLRSQGRS
ncbi:hypothetical protein GIB67_031716, partial [Kingdonia uniflora]